MPQPTPGDVHVNRPLTNISVAYMQEAANFVASRVFPLVPVAKQSDSYFTYTQANWFRNDVKKRAPATESAGGGWNMSTASYACDVFAIHKDIDDQLRANADAPINLDSDATRYVTQQLLLQMEAQFVTDAFVASTWTGAATGNDQTGVAGVPAADQFLQWNDVASTPIEVISRLMDQMQQKTGVRPNKLVLGPQVWTELKHHPDILDRIKYTQAGGATLCRGRPATPAPRAGPTVTRSSTGRTRCWCTCRPAPGC